MASVLCYNSCTSQNSRINFEFRAVNPNSIERKMDSNVRPMKTESKTVLLLDEFQLLLYRICFKVYYTHQIDAFRKV
jgi:hypothetical protein